MADPSPIYGLDARSQMGVRTACNDLSRTISTLEAHHADELPATRAALEALAVKLDALPAAARDLLLEPARLAEAAATGLRSQRAALLEHLLTLRAPLVDVMLEAHRLQDPDAALGAHVEAHVTLPPPTPLPGLDPDAEGRLRILEKTLMWSRQMTYSQAVVGLGPCYLLSHAIDHPTAEAEALRTGLIEATERVRGFIVRTFQY